MGRGIQKVFTISLDNARDGERIDVLGRYIQITDSSNPSATINVAVQDNIGANKYHRLVVTGEINEAQGFSRLYLKNTAQAGEWVKLIVTDGPDDFYVKAGDFGTISGITNPVVTKGGDTINADTVTVDNTAAGVEIIAANSSRTGWSIQNPSAALDLLIGPSGSAVYPVPPGGEKSGTGTHAIYGRYSSGSESVPYLEESKS
ncbi:MAG: hypothetical protein H6863_06530 [Rhodospirillales bacterium]|nr:hypothetical protein [Rhodospirillales bacterium]